MYKFPNNHFDLYESYKTCMNDTYMNGYFLDETSTKIAYDQQDINQWAIGSHKENTMVLLASNKHNIHSYLIINSKKFIHICMNEKKTFIHIYNSYINVWFIHILYDSYLGLYDSYISCMNHMYEWIGVYQTQLSLLFNKNEAFHSKGL